MGSRELTILRACRWQLVSRCRAHRGNSHHFPQSCPPAEVQSQVGGVGRLAAALRLDERQERRGCRAGAVICKQVGNLCLPVENSMCCMCHRHA